MALEGNITRSGTALKTSLLIHPGASSGFEFRPAWSWINGNLVEDADVSVLAGWNYFSFSAGCRWLESRRESLNGPHLGLSIRY